MNVSEAARRIGLNAKSRRTRELVVEKSQQLQTRVTQRVSTQQVRQAMASRRRGDEWSECAILDDLAHPSEGNL